MSVSETLIAILLPDMRGGGTERVCLNLANEFAARGVRVQLVLMCAAGELLPLLDPRVEVIDLGAARMRGVLWPLTRYLRREQPEALLANMWPLTFLAPLAKWLASAQCRIVAVEHIAWSAGILPMRWHSKLAFIHSVRWLQGRVDRYLAVSRGAVLDLERIAGLPSGAVAVQHNPVVRDMGGQALPHCLDLRWLDGPHRRIIAVGTLKEQKDFSLLLHAVAKARDQVDARLLILGEGHLRPLLETTVKELGLTDRVEMPGFVLAPEAYYSRADLFVLSSTHEGLPTVLIEALSHGVPVVATDCPSGPREILNDGEYGALVPVRDVAALSTAIVSSLECDHDRDALIRRSQEFRVDAIADQYLLHLLPNFTFLQSKPSDLGRHGKDSPFTAQPPHRIALDEGQVP